MSENLEGTIAAALKHARNNSALVRAVDRVKPSTKTGMQKSEATVCSPRKLRVGTWNVESMKGRASEVVEAITRRKVDICCLTETRGKARGLSGLMVEILEQSFSGKVLRMAMEELAYLSRKYGVIRS